MDKQNNQQIALEFINDEITAWGSIALLKKLMDKSGFREILNKNWHYILSAAHGYKTFGKDLYSLYL